MFLLIVINLIFNLHSEGRYLGAREWESRGSGIKECGSGYTQTECNKARRDLGLEPNEIDKKSGRIIHIDPIKYAELRKKGPLTYTDLMMAEVNIVETESSLFNNEILSCGYGLITGLGTGLKDMVVGIWDLGSGAVKVIGLDIAAIFSKDARDELIRVSDKQGAVFKGVSEILSDSYVFLLTYFADELNGKTDKERTEFICAVIGSLSVDIIITIGTGYGLVKLSKVKSIAAFLKQHPRVERALLAFKKEPKVVEEKPVAPEVVPTERYFSVDSKGDALEVTVVRDLPESNPGTAPVLKDSVAPEPVFQQETYYEIPEMVLDPDYAPQTSRSLADELLPDEDIEDVLLRAKKKIHHNHPLAIRAMESRMKRLILRKIGQDPDFLFKLFDLDDAGRQALLDESLMDIMHSSLTQLAMPEEMLELVNIDMLNRVVEEVLVEIL